MKDSERTFGIRELPEREKPVSEQFRLKSDEWADAENAAHILEEMKTATLETMKSKEIIAGPGIANNKAERLVKSSKAWSDYINKMCAARHKANKLKLELKYLGMRHREWIGANADARSERRM
jgi:hypothetical protein